MIDVGVAQDHRIDGGGVERKRKLVALGRIAAALDQAAVEQDRIAVRSQDVARARDLARRAEEFELHAALRLL
jgi:hypothetical protein